jgi:hypothetical protein
VIAGGHVLTARHCSSGGAPGDLLWLRLAAPGDEFGTVDLPVRVVDEDAGLDVAVLGVDPARDARGDTVGKSASEVLGRVWPLPVSVPAVAGALIRTQGYPRDGRDGGLAFTGTLVDPAALLRKHRVFVLQLHLDELAASVPHGPGGHSGGPVLATSVGSGEGVVGVVRAYPPDETREYAVGGSLLASRIQDLAARFPAVREAFAHRCVEILGRASVPPMPQAPSLATLIRADAGHTRFFGRELELRRLHSWCATQAARAAMVMTGPAGQGKTRLAQQLCEQLTATHQWIALTLRGVESDEHLSLGLALASVAQRPLLLVVDYAAEYGARQLRSVIDQLCTHGPPQWRLLLIARHTGDWWDGDITTGVLAGLRAAAVEVASDPLRLGELVAVGSDRHDAYKFILDQLRTPLAAFAAQHRLRIRADPPTPPLARPEYGSALMLHIAAVCALLPDSRPGTRPAERLSPSNVVERFLDLERDHHWLYRDANTLHHSTVMAFGDLATGEAGRYLIEATVAAATLAGAASHEQACQLLTTALGIELRRAERIAYWLRDLYPPPTETPTSGILHPLEPDLLGEELVARVLRRQLDHGLPEDQVLPFTLAGVSSEGQTQRMLTVLIRAAERHSWIAELLTTSPGGKPSGRGAGLFERIALTTNLSVVENALPRHNIHLLRVAVQLTQRLLDRLDHLSGQTAGTTGPHAIAERARLLGNLAIRLAEVGQRQDAVPVSQEAVELRRELAAATPDQFNALLERAEQLLEYLRYGK